MQIISQGIYLEDIGPWDKFKTITNNIENVVKIVDQNLQLMYHKRIGEYPVIYKDSTNNFVGVKIKNNIFVDFVYIGKFDNAADAMNEFKKNWVKE